MENLVATLFEPWPHWARRWWGVLTRVLVGLGGLALGGGMVFLGYFGATFKKHPPEWNLESIGVVVIGMMVILSALAMAIRPSRLTIGSVAAVVVTAGVVGALI